MTQNTNQQPRPWKHGVCDICAGGSTICLRGLFCTPCLLATARNEYDSSNWCFNCLCMTGASTRNVIREGYHIDGDCCEDILCSIICPMCSACQIVVEVQETGHIGKNNEAKKLCPDV